MTTTLETTDGSCKFYRVQVNGLKTIVTHGKVGSEGQDNEMKHSSTAEASTYAEDLIDKLQNNGYEKTNNKRKREVDNGPRKSARLVLSRAAKVKAIAAMAAPKAVSKKQAGASTKKTTKKATAKRATATKETIKLASTTKATAKKATTSTKNKGGKDITPQKNAGSGKSSKRPSKVAKSKVPMEWEVKLRADGYGIYVNDTHVYSGDESGLVQQFDKSGVVQKQYRLPSGVMCIVGDGIFLYVGTNDGALYDITTGVPRLLSKIEAFSEVYWMDIRHGQIAASDKAGKVALINTEGETIWIHKEKGKHGWMCFMDDTGVYHGNSTGVHKRELTKGTKVWDTTGFNGVLFGQQDEDFVYATHYDLACKINKKDGKVVVTYNSGGRSMGVSKDSKMIVTAKPLTVYNSDGSLVRQFEDPTSESQDDEVVASVHQRVEGEALVPAEDTVPYSLATWGENEFYGIGDHLIKYNLSPENVAKGKAGIWKTQSFNAQSLAEVMPETSVEVTSDTSGGVLCECIKEDDKLRIRVISPGYNNSWNVQFPRAIREEGVKFVVEKIESQEGFYRAWGDIKKVQS